MKKENMVMENNQEMSAEELEQVNGGNLGELVGATLALGATVAIGAAAVAGAATVGVLAAVAESSTTKTEQPAEPEKPNGKPEHRHHRDEFGPDDCYCGEPDPRFF